MISCEIEGCMRRPYTTIFNRRAYHLCDKHINAVMVIMRRKRR